MDGPSSTRPSVETAPPQGEPFGRYVRSIKLGAGGMGEVWKAWDTELKRWVALKLMKGGDPEEIARFKREAQLAASLSHPNIAAVHEVGAVGDKHFIAMQLIDGPALATFAGRPARLVAELVRDAAVRTR